MTPTSTLSSGTDSCPHSAGTTCTRMSTHIAKPGTLAPILSFQATSLAFGDENHETSQLASPAASQLPARARASGSSSNSRKAGTQTAARQASTGPTPGDGERRPPERCVSSPRPSRILLRQWRRMAGWLAGWLAGAAGCWPPLGLRRTSSVQ